MRPSTGIATDITQAARRLGFDRCAIAEVGATRRSQRLREWLARGMHGDMQWLARAPERRADPGQVVSGAGSIVLVTRSYFNHEAPADSPTCGQISRYARGGEYHEVMGTAIRALYACIQDLLPGIRGRYYVDTGPVMEKAWAEAAGLGWIGKHTNLISVGVGSWFFLGAIILDTRLPAGPPAHDHCGSCRACIDACPTGAIVAPYVLDARLCISYLTIELRGPIPRHLRELLGNRIFGCDDCQDVCPWNRFARASAAARVFASTDRTRSPSLADLLRLDRETFRERFRGSPVMRARYEGFLRNVAVALGNSGDPAMIGVLVEGLAHVHPLVRGHCAWALGRLGGGDAVAALGRGYEIENDAWVLEEIQAALEETRTSGDTLSSRAPEKASDMVDSRDHQARARGCDR